MQLQQGQQKADRIISAEVQKALNKPELQEHLQGLNLPRVMRQSNESLNESQPSISVEPPVDDGIKTESETVSKFFSDTFEYLLPSTNVLFVLPNVFVIG